MSLASLIRGNSVPDKFATATPATFATEPLKPDRSVATVATVAVAMPRIERRSEVSGASENNVQWGLLAAAIDSCCDARGDSPENRAALLADCREEPVTNWPWLTQHFNGEAILFGARATLANAMAQGANDD